MCNAFLVSKWINARSMTCFEDVFFSPSAGVWRRDRLSGSFLKQQSDTFSICRFADWLLKLKAAWSQSAKQLCSTVFNCVLWLSTSFNIFQHCDPRLRRSVRDMSRARLKASHSWDVACHVTLFELFSEMDILQASQEEHWWCSVVACWSHPWYRLA